MTEPSSVLQVISKKELELRRRVEEARDQAEELIRVARAEAEQLVTQADEQARAEAEEIYQLGVEEARQKAEALLESARAQAVELQQQTRTGLDRAVQRIVGLVLPGDTNSAEPLREATAQLADQIGSS